tara:strand:+ start:1376 stop:1546 length:171 start_codon:yes stop_codon:yes gene_type:complete
MDFTPEQIESAILNNDVVKKSFGDIKAACKALKDETSCPDEDVDSLLEYLVGRWKN